MMTTTTLPDYSNAMKPISVKIDGFTTNSKPVDLSNFPVAVLAVALAKKLLRQLATRNWLDQSADR